MNGINLTHQPLNPNRIFGLGVALNVAYIVLEAVAGILIHSTALIADAGHNLSDVLGLLLAWGAVFLAKAPASKNRTYGMKKATIMAAFVNAVILLIAVGAIGIEAIQRFFEPQEVAGTTMMMIAGVGVFINGATALLFVRGKERDINIRGAFIHMIADAGVSLGVVVAGWLINVTGMNWIDPAVSLVIVVVIMFGSAGLLKDSFHLSMDAVPSTVAYDAVKEYLASVPGVRDVHHLHIWALSSTETALTAHVVVRTDSKPRADELLVAMTENLQNRFGIDHPTIQIEGNADCATCKPANL